MQQSFMVRLQNQTVTLTVERGDVNEVLVFVCPTFEEAQELADRVVDRLRSMGVDMQHVEPEDVN